MKRLACDSSKANRPGLSLGLWLNPPAQAPAGRYNSRGKALGHSGGRGRGKEEREGGEGRKAEGLPAVSSPGTPLHTHFFIDHAFFSRALCLPLPRCLTRVLTGIRYTFRAGIHVKLHKLAQARLCLNSTKCIGQHTNLLLKRPPGHETFIKMHLHSKTAFRRVECS